MAQGAIGGDSVVSAFHQWNPDEWELFALSLLQSRHGALDVHKIPATHKGDLGIDFYCTSESVIYQCFSVDEPVDILTRAKRQKTKITTDLKKITDGATDVFKLLLGKPLRRWALLVPLHDSKEVNLHCSKKTVELRAKALSFLDADFEVCIQDQDAFPGAALASAVASLTTVTLSVIPPTPAELSAWKAGSADLVANATQKLIKRTGPANIQSAVADAVQYFLQGNALIDALRSGAPELHEKVSAAVASRARSLNFAGPQGGPAPSAILHTELLNLVGAIKEAAPTLSATNAEEIALGTLAEWIMRCPLDFPTHAS